MLLKLELEKKEIIESVPNQTESLWIYDLFAFLEFNKEDLIRKKVFALLFMQYWLDIAGLLNWWLF